MLPETLKAKLDIHSSKDMGGLPKNLSKQLFTKYVMPSSFLGLKKNLALRNDQEFSLLNSTRKYFGRKIICLSNPGIQADSIRKCFRYFREMKFEQVNSEEDLSDSIVVTIKSLGNLGVLDQPIEVDMESVRRLLSVCPCEVSIESNNHVNARWWMSIPTHMKSQIKHLKIAFSRKEHSQLLEGTHLFKDFNTIESCNISLINDYYYQQPNPLPVGFLSVLCQIKTLKSLGLDLSKTPMSRETLTLFLNQISAHEPFRWYFKVLLEHKTYNFADDYNESEKNPIEIDKVKTILNKLDFLGLRIGYPDKEGEEFYQYNPTEDLSNMEHLTKKRRRILDITFVKGKNLHLKDFLIHCTSLKGIYTRSISNSCFEINNNIKGGRMMYGYNYEEESQDEDNREGEDQLKANAWANNLEDAVLSVNGYDIDVAPKISSFLSVVQKQSHNLRYLELFCCESTGGACVTPKSDDICMLIDGLEQFALLEELKLTSDGNERDIRRLNNVLQRLSNLRKLHLVLGIGREEQAAWDKTFSFENCRNLEELKITINPDMKAKPWGINLIKKCQYLQSLSVLEIYDQAKPMFLKTFCSLVRKFMELKNLRKLILETSVKSSSAFQEIPEELQEDLKFSVDALLEKLRVQVKTFIFSNPKLEEFYIGELEGFDFEYMAWKSALKDKQVIYFDE